MLVNWSVLCFALSMLFGFDYGSYFSSMFIAFSFVSMMYGYAYFAENGAISGLCFSGFFRYIYSHHIISLFCTANDCKTK